MILAILRTAWGFLAAIPLKVWLVIAAALAAYAVERWHAGTHDAKGYARASAEYEQRIADERALQAQADEEAQDKLDALAASLREANKHAETALQAAETKRRADVAALKGKLHVTQQELARCSDLPRSLLRHDAHATAIANGANPPAPAASPIPLDAPSGVSPAAIGDALVDRANAYATCRERNAGWLQYHAEVERWAAEVRRIMEAR